MENKNLCFFSATVGVTERHFPATRPSVPRVTPHIPGASSIRGFWQVFEKPGFSPTAGGSGRWWRQDRPGTGHGWNVLERPGRIGPGTAESFHPRREIGLLQWLVFAAADHALDASIGGADQLPFALPFPVHGVRIELTDVALALETRIDQQVFERRRVTLGADTGLVIALIARRYWSPRYNSSASRSRFMTWAVVCTATSAARAITMTAISRTA